MFRKPKNKATIRQRAKLNEEEGDNHEENSEQFAKPSIPALNLNDEDDVKPVVKKNTVFSFDMDEGADAEFEVKKNKKQVEKMKRLQQLEEEANRMATERRIEEEKAASERTRELELSKAIRREKEAKKEQKKKEEKRKYLDKYRDNSAKHIRDDDEYEEDEIHNKFGGGSDAIPDSRAVYEAKKRREKMRKESRDGYIPLDDTQKLKTRNARERLVREDDNDDSDEEAGKFYSAHALVKSEEAKRREVENEFLSMEQGDDDDRRDGTIEEWENQQIMKAVSGRAIGELRASKMQQDMYHRMYHTTMNGPEEEQEPEDMDVDIEYIVQKSSGPQNTGGVVTLEDIMAKMKLKLQDRKEALNRRRHEVKKMKDHLEENNSLIGKLGMDLPDLQNRFQMYQELRVYCRCLLECLNEKVGDINELADKRRDHKRARTERIIKRRRRDIRDQYAECAATAAGKNISTVKTGDAALRAAEREGRRIRRRKMREATTEQHDEGISTDDEEPTSQSIADKQIDGEIDAAASVVFADALTEYASLRPVLERMMDWLAMDTKSFQDAYVHLCIPKLSSPYVRLELINGDVLGKETSMTEMNWYRDAILAGSANTSGAGDHEVVVGLVPAIVEKVVLPFLTDVIREEWDPLSSTQTKRLAAFTRPLPQYPNLTERSKSFIGFLEAIRQKLITSIDEDLFVPMFAPAALDNPVTGCRHYLDRQFWSSIKLIRNINQMKHLISEAARFELIIECIVNRVCVVALRMASHNPAACERKIRAIIAELDDGLLNMGGMTTYRQMVSTFNKIADQMKGNSRDFYDEVKAFIGKLER